MKTQLLEIRGHVGAEDARRTADLDRGGEGAARNETGERALRNRERTGGLLECQERGLLGRGNWWDCSLHIRVKLPSGFDARSAEYVLPIANSGLMIFVQNRTEETSGRDF